MTTAILIVLGVALVYVAVQMKAGASWAPKAAAALAVLVIAVGVARWGCQQEADPEDEIAEALSAEEASAREMASALAKHVAKGRKVLVFATIADPDAYDRVVQGLKQGLEPCGATFGIVSPPVRPDDPEGRMLHRDCQAIVARHPEVGGVLVYGDPAADLEDFVPKGKLPVGILARRLKPKEAVARVKQGTAAVVAIVRPDVDWSEIDKLDGPVAKFRRTYLVITQENVDEIEKQLP